MSMNEQKELSMAQAVKEALQEEMCRDDKVFVLGEDVGKAGGTFKVFAGLFDEFGPERVIDTPISEAAIVGAAVGAAMTGMRPVVDVMFCDFLTLAMDQIVNQAAKLRYMTGGQVTIPMVIHSSVGSGTSSAAQHSQSLYTWFAHIPGLKVVIPSTPMDAKGLLKSAIRDNNPVLCFEDKTMYKTTGIVPAGEYTIPLGQADIKREGKDVTIVATMRMVHLALKAAEMLAEQEINAEVIDPRTLKPLDGETIVRSVRKTGRAVVVDQGYLNFGATAEIASLIAEKAFDWLETPVKRLGAIDAPSPYSPPLDLITIPSEKNIFDTVMELFKKGDGFGN